MNIDILDFGAPEKENSIIKVIGVGGGGGNAVNHMYREGIHDVTFVLCNTDNQALNDSPVPVHLQLGKEGLGAGNKPEIGQHSAEENIEEIPQACRRSDSCLVVYTPAIPASSFCVRSYLFISFRTSWMSSLGVGCMGRSPCVVWTRRDSCTIITECQVEFSNRQAIRSTIPLPIGFPSSGCASCRASGSWRCPRFRSKNDWPCQMQRVVHRQ